MCTQCQKPVFDSEDLIDGLCDSCVDDLLTLRIPANDGGYARKPTMKSEFCGNIGVVRAKPIGSKKIA